MRGRTMNKLSTAKRAQIIGMLVEGNSLRAVTRMSGCSINTVTKLLVDVGTACARYQDKTLRNLTKCTRLQCDEIWSFCYAKEKNVPEELKGQFGIGDVWTWTAICADTKLVPCWMVGDRSAATAEVFMDDLAGRLPHRVQLTTDGHSVYVDVVDCAFEGAVDYAMLIKLFGNDAGVTAERKYSPAECSGTRVVKISGTPDAKQISTSFVERQNLTMRMSMWRFTRLTNGFSKKVENHMAAVSLHLMHYNFARVHKTLRVTPAMEAGVTDHVWSLEEIVGLLG
jgi:IS1 family transposase